jgi:cell division protein FtsL
MKRKVTIRFKLIVLLACAVYAGFVFINQSTVLGQLNQEKSDLKKQYEEQKAQYAELQNEVQYVGSDAYVEKTAREKLGWVKEGETKFVQENK